MTILKPTHAIDRIYNLISTIANLFALIISLFLLLLIIYRFIRCQRAIRKKYRQNISILLSLNTLVLIFLRCLFQLCDIDLNTIKRNYFAFIEYENSFACQFRGYVLLSIHATLYWSYALQAFYRFVRVNFSHVNYFQRLSIYVYAFLPGQFFISFVSVFPLFRGFNVIHLLSNEPYCTASYNHLASLIYMPIVAFVLPLIIISICYLAILWKTSHSIVFQRVLLTRQNRRHILVVRRIILLILILSAVSLPLFIDLFIYLPKGSRDPYMNSIGWLSSTINAIILAISIPIINPKIQELCRQNNQITN